MLNATITATLAKQQPISQRTRQRIIDDMEGGEVSTRFCVLYLKERKEHRTAWFKSRELAHVALRLIRKKYGDKNAIVYID